MRFLLSLLAGVVLSGQAMAGVTMRTDNDSQDIHMYRCQVVRNLCSEDGGSKFYTIKQALINQVAGSEKYNYVEIMDMILYEGDYFITYKFY